jgi:hypothetical protein
MGKGVMNKHDAKNFLRHRAYEWGLESAHAGLPLEEALTIVRQQMEEGYDVAKKIHAESSRLDATTKGP